jgi:surface carbohydrate biosynthesis protein
MNIETVLIVVASPGRDFESAALVGYHLASRYRRHVAYCDWRNVAGEILKHAPIAVIFDRPRVKEMMLAARLGSGVAVIPTVGYYQDPELFLRRWIVERKEVSEAISCYFTWENDSRRVLSENGLLPVEKIYTVGCTRFDLYAPKYLALVEPRQSFLAKLGFQSVEAPLVVWGTATYFRRTRDHGSAWWFSRSISDPDKRELQDEETIYRSISECIVTLAAKRPEWNFLIKVHPSELSYPYQQLTARFRNIKVAYGVPLRAVLHHCDVLVQRGSTAATEAWILGKPVIEATFGKYNVPIKDEMLAGNEIITSIDEAENFITRCILKNGISAAQLRAREQFLRNTYSLLDGAASERCARYINEFAIQPRIGDHARRHAATGKEAIIRSEQESRRFSNRLKHVLRMDENSSLQLWRLRRNSEHGSDLCDQVMTEEMVISQYRRFAAVLDGTVPDTWGTSEDPCAVAN